MCRKVAYYGMPCLWEHENALQRSQDKKKHEMQGQTKAQVENRSRETAATGVTVPKNRTLSSTGPLSVQ